MYFLDVLFRPTDIFIWPICVIILMMAFSVVLRKYKEEKIKKLFLQAFYFKMAITLLYTFVNSYYYRGGDSEMYYHCTQLLSKAVSDDADNLFTIFTTKAINVKTPLMTYFQYAQSPYPVWEAMHDPGNFMVPKLGLIPAVIFNNSYLSIATIFSFFALGGAIRLFKFLYHYFPQYWREIALATLFIPSVGFWSAGLLKDPICFGAVGYIVYGIFNIFIKRKKIFSSIVWIAVCATLLFYIKVYILLAIAPALVIWLFREVNKVVENKTLRGIMAIMTFAIGAILAVVLLNYVTSDESMKKFRIDAILETSAQNREIYEDIGAKYEGSYFNLGTTNPVLIIPNGIIAALFRPFLWEANSITALLSAFESLFFLYLTIFYMFKKGVGSFFRNIFKSPVLVLCFIFSLVFAAAVGSTALNFGSLSRYKIPCLPFYLGMLLILYQQAGVQFPRWFKKMLGYKSAPRWANKTAF
jgi:hypothetical protein